MDNDETFSAKETARRRDEVVRRMAHTPPQPKVTRKMKKKAGAGHTTGKRRARREP